MERVLWVLSKIRNIADQMHTDVFLVGGFVRDLFLGEYAKDIDLLVKGPCLEFSHAAAKELEGSFVPLAPERDIYRVVVKRLGIQVDVASPAEGHFVTDLFRRDFTCNAVALSVKDFLETRAWWERAVDPTRGLEDLARRQLRPVAGDSFTTDPVRIIRGVRLAEQLGLELSDNYHGLAKNAAHLLAKVAGERIRQELWLLLARDGVQPLIAALDSWGVIEGIFPAVREMSRTEQNYYHAEHVWAHCLRTLKVLENEGCDYLPRSLNQRAGDYSDGQLTVGGTRRQMLKLAALFHDVGKIDTAACRPDGRITFHGHDKAGVPYCREYAQRLALSRREGDSWARLTAMHMRPLALFVQGAVSDRAVLRLLRDAGDDAGMLLQLAYADVAATREASNQDMERGYVEFLTRLWEQYFRLEEQGD